MYVATSTVLGEDMTFTTPPRTTARKGSVHITAPSKAFTAKPPPSPSGSTLPPGTSESEAEGAGIGMGPVAEEITDWKKYLLWGGLAVVGIAAIYFAMKR